MTNNDLISRSEFRRSLIIWAEKLHIAGACGGCEAELLQAVIKMVDAQEAVDAEPVRHGEWIYDPNANDFGIGGYICNVCSAKNNNLPCNAVINPQIFVGSRFCPDCGARMDGGKNNGTAK